MRTLVLLAMTGFVITGCNDNKEKELAWQSKYDSLHNELKAREEVVGLLQHVNVYMDSIESYEKWLKVEMETGLEPTDINSRMKNLMQYVKQTEKTIRSLEKTKTDYSGMVAKLRQDFDKKNKELLSLQQQLEQYSEQNASLVAMVSQRDEELEIKTTELTLKDAELKVIEQKVEDLLQQAQQLEAESYYSRAKALELAAQRTKLAPKKKKQTLMEAHELYRKALDKGYASASQDIERLGDLTN